MADIKVNGCREDTKGDLAGESDKDKIINNKVTQNHVDCSQGDNCDTNNAQSSQVNKDNDNFVNHKNITGYQEDRENEETKPPGSKNLNGTNEEDSFNEETEKDDKYSGFGIRPHNADEKDEEEMDSPPRMVFSLAGFAPLNVEKEKDSLNTDTVGGKEGKEAMDSTEIKNEVDKNQEVTDKDEGDKSDSKMDCSDSDKVGVKADNNKKQENAVNLDNDIDSSKKHGPVEDNSEKSVGSIEKPNDDAENGEKNENKNIDSNSENCNKEVIEDRKTNDNGEISTERNTEDKIESKENNKGEMNEAEIDDSVLDNEGCSDREDKQDGDNDSIVILDEEGDSVKNKNNDSAPNTEVEKMDVDDEKKVDAGKSNDQDKDIKGEKSVDKVIVDGSEIVITINEDESGDDSGKDADDESDDDDDDNKERKKKLHNKVSPTKTPQVSSQDKNKNNSSDNDLVVLDNNLPNNGKKPDGPGGIVQKQTVTQKTSRPVVAVPPGYVATNSTNRPYILPAPTSQVPSTGQPATGGQYYKVMGQKTQAVYMPVSSQYIITNTAAPNQTKVVKSGQPCTVTASSQPATAAAVKSGTGSILTDKIDEDVASSSWEQLELVKYDIAMRKPDNTFWMGLANVNKKAEISSVTKFLFDLGSDIVKESAYRQIINVQNKKLDSGKLNQSEVESLDKMKSVVKDLKAKVGFLDLKQARCKGCGFQTSSKTVMRMHKEYPHMTPPYDMYGVLNCVHCDFNTKIPTNYTYHMSAEHNMTGRVYDKPALHQCNLCQFESNAKPKLTQHRTKCTKTYKPHLNQAPYHFDINYCLKNIFYKFQIKKPPQPKADPRPQKVLPSKNPIIQPKNLRAVFPGPTNPRPQVGGRFVLGPNQNVYRLNVPNQPQYNQQFQQFAISSGNQQRPGFNQRPIQGPNMPYSKISPRPQFERKPTVGELIQQKKAVNNTVAQRPQLQPRPQAAPPQQPTKQANTGGFEVCEMCGGYVKDKMSLRIHFYYAHKIDMPATVFNRPNAPLVCEVCKKRFWTTQGLTKHKQSMKHNYIPNKPVVTPQNSQAMCWICHQKPDNLYSHLHKFHKLTTSECMGLKRCMFCGTLCSTRKELEIHMAAAHGVLIKGEGGQTTPNTKPVSASPGNVVPKPGAGVSVSTRTVVTGTGNKANPALVRNNFCVFCAKQFSDNTALTLHCLRDHATCSGCGMVVAKASDLKTHVCKVNKSRSCEICGIKNLKSVYYTKHVTSHLKKCNVKLKRLGQGEIAAAVKRKRTDVVSAGENIEIISDSQSEDDSPAEKVKKVEQKTDVEMKSEDNDNKQENNSKEDKNNTVEKDVKVEKEIKTETNVDVESNNKKVEGANADVKEEPEEIKTKDNEEKIEDVKTEVKEKIIENKEVKEEIADGLKSDVKEDNVFNTDQDGDKSSGNKRKSEDESDDITDVQPRKRLRSSDKSD